MMLSSFTMLILSITVTHIFYQVNSAGLSTPYDSNMDVKFDVKTTPTFDQKFESLIQISQKMDESIQRLQEKTHTWAIFQHHIESWNDGIRILENKLDLLQRKQEEQQQQLEKLEHTIGHVMEKDALVREEIRHALEREYNMQMVSSTKLNTILKYIQTKHFENSSGTVQTSQKKTANVMAPINTDNIINKIDQQINSVLRQMAQQKDLKQLHSLEKRNSKSLEALNYLLAEASDKQEEITIRMQRSNECCYSLSNELTTFTESSDILLKRIEKLVRNVNEKLLEIEQFHTNKHDEEEDMDDVENDDVHTTVHTVVKSDVFSDENNENEDEDIVDTDQEIEEMETETDASINSEPNKHDQRAVGDDFDEGVKEDMEEVENDDDTTVQTVKSDFNDENHKNENEDVDAAEEIEEMKRETDTSINSKHDQSAGGDYHENVQEIEFIRPNLRGCHELDASIEDRIDGIYKFLTPEINERERDFNERFCVYSENNDSQGRPWTVIQNRGPYKPQENFNRSWVDYRNGFGSLYRDFWFGNEFIHRLVYPEDYELRIELEDFNGTKVWAEYATFRIESEQYNYNLLISGFNGTVGNAMTYHNDKDFSTYDRRNDRTVDTYSCAMGYGSGWWFDNCAEANLNGIYWATPLGHRFVGILWELWHGDYSLKSTRMMIRPCKSDITSKLNSDEHQTEDP